MSLDPKYPIVMERFLYCSGQCKRYTTQHSVIYPDTESNTCKVCGHKATVHYDRSVAVVYKDIDRLALEGIESDLNRLAGDVAYHKFGHLGKKDLAYIEKIVMKINAIRRHVTRLKNDQEEADGEELA